MKYEEVAKKVRRTARVNNGYFGKTTVVGIAFLEGRAVIVAPCGYYGANNYKYADEKEMLYYYDNHRHIHFPQIINTCKAITKEK